MSANEGVKQLIHRAVKNGGDMKGLNFNKIFEGHHPETIVEIPGFRCERGVRADGLSWLRISKTVTIKDGFEFPPKHVFTVFSNGTTTGAKK